MIQFTFEEHSQKWLCHLRAHVRTGRANEGRFGEEGKCQAKKNGRGKKNAPVRNYCNGALRLRLNRSSWILF